MIPPAVVAAFHVLQTIGARNENDLRAVEAKPSGFGRLFGRSHARDVIRASEIGWLAEAIAPWRQEGKPRTTQVRTNGWGALARFAEFDDGTVAVLEFILQEGTYRFREVRRIPAAEYHEFGEVVT